MACSPVNRVNERHRNIIQAQLNRIRERESRKQQQVSQSLSSLYSKETELKLLNLKKTVAKMHTLDDRKSKQAGQVKLRREEELARKKSILRNKQAHEQEHAKHLAKHKTEHALAQAGRKISKRKIDRHRVKAEECLVKKHELTEQEINELASSVERKAERISALKQLRKKQADQKWEQLVKSTWETREREEHSIQRVEQLRALIDRKRHCGLNKAEESRYTLLLQEYHIN